LLLAAIAFAEAWRWKPAAAAVLALAILAPATIERRAYLANNANWGRENLAAYATAAPALDATIRRVKEIGGRVYAGVPAGWGGQHKIGSTPFFAFLSVRQVPAVAYLYHAMALTAEIQPRLNEWDQAQYRLFGIRSVVAPAGIQTALPPFWHRDQIIGRFDTFTIAGSTYFDVVDAPEVARIDKASFYDVNDRWLQSDQVEKRRHLLLDYAGVVSAPAPLPAGAGEPGIVTASDDREATVQVQRPAYLLFKMTWHPNWQARVDGARVPTVMLSPGFIGVAVPPGSHKVTMHYQGSVWRLWLALAGVLAVAGARGVTLLRYP
jgi:Bacterial membrane protein YfhO